MLRRPYAFGNPAAMGGESTPSGPTLYYINQGFNSWIDPTNWFEDQEGTIPHGAVPTVGDNCQIIVGNTVDEVPSSGYNNVVNYGTVNNNNGTITTNASSGTVDNNYGTVSTNNGTVSTNNGTVSTNNGTVTNNNVSVGTNNGTIAYNDGTTTANNDTIINNTSTGIVTYNCGTIVTNDGYAGPCS